MVQRKQRRYRKIEVSFLGRDTNSVKYLVHLCRLIGKIELFPKDMYTSDLSPQAYSFILKLRPRINRSKAEDVLLNTWPVRSVKPTK